MDNYIQTKWQNILYVECGRKIMVWFGIIMALAPKQSLGHKMRGFITATLTPTSEALKTLDHVHKILN